MFWGRYIIWNSFFSSEGPGHDLTSGGYSFSVIAVDKTNEDVTHDSYFQEVDAWLAERQKEKEMQKEAEQGLQE